jgi:acyl dehydratase
MSWMYFEDFEPGQVDRFGSYHFERDEMIRFARAYDPQAFHLDEEAGRSSIFGRMAASGWHTTAGMMKCWSAYSFGLRAERAKHGLALPEIGPSPGIEALKWPRPVYPGDTVSYWGEVLSKRLLTSRPRWGLTTSRIEGVNQDGVKVLTFVSKLMVERRASGQVA